ncbi:MAG TPA: bacteriohemerythrin [Symbiobacteriaceae bacterium]|nr:bacteriohemerythrin [Symbiobacteriaceae bacterium]
MAIQWTEALAVGINDIDTQHKELFRQADLLLEASQKGIGMDELDRTLQFLGKYVVDHFGTEERYMDKFNYPASDFHKKEHADFVAEFVKTKERIAKEGASLSLLFQVQKRIVEWLNNHIRKEDKALGAYLKTKMVALK